jgi:Flp pilus assembly protein TadD
MTLTCPCCKAANAADTCRRCKADLSLLAAVEAAREHHLTLARRFAAELRSGEALAHLDRAAALRPGDDLRPVRAAVLLAAGRFADALSAYHATV